MVAYTSPDCLPYFECGDLTCVNTGDTCDPSTVWCDQAALIDAKLDFFDSVVTRTANSVPMAWVETTTPFVMTETSPSEVPVLFTTVRADSAQMVNLDSFSRGFEFTYPGLYLIVGYAAGVTDTNFGAGVSTSGSLSIEFSGNTVTYPPTTLLPFIDVRWELFVNDVQFRANSQMMVPIGTVGTQAIVNTTSSGGGTREITYNKISVAAIWMADLP